MISQDLPRAKSKTFLVFTLLLTITLTSLSTALLVVGLPLSPNSNSLSGKAHNEDDLQGLRLTHAHRSMLAKRNFSPVSVDALRDLSLRNKISDNNNNNKNSIKELSSTANSDGLKAVLADRLLNTSSGIVLTNVAIIINGSNIAQVVLNFTGKLPGNVTDIVDLRARNLTLLPGLTDCHTHLTFQLCDGSSIDTSQADTAYMSTVYARRTVEAGFTTVRNLGAPSFIDISLVKAIDQGMVVGPRIIPSGSAITITGGHGDNTGHRPGLDDGTYKEGVVNGPDSVRHAVRYQAKFGAKVIKLFATAGVLSEDSTPGRQQLSDEEMQAACDEAKRQGLKSAAHAHGTQGIKAAILAGVDSIEHGSILDGDAIQMMLDQGTYLVPTSFLTVAMNFSCIPPDERAKAAIVFPLAHESLKRAISAGVKIAFGTDAGVYPHGQNAGEFGMYVQFGLSPLKALQTATIAAADLIGVPNIGQVDAGFVADLVAVPGNPLTDVNLMRQVQFVMKDGVIIKPLAT